MERDYPRRLNALAASLPAGARVIALLTEGDRSESAALAVDLAAAISEHRAGHTILASLEDAPSALDHQVGEEGGPGLSDVLRGRRTLAEVAGSGRARGFIYLPAGDDPIAADRLLASRGWAKLSSAAAARGATLLLFLPPGIRASSLGPVVDGIVWLGERRSAGGGEGGVGAERAAGGPIPVLGRLVPPGSGPRGVPPAPVPAARDAPPASRRPGRRLGGVLLLLAGGAVVAAVIAVAGSGDREPFLPQNDSLWSSPVHVGEEGVESDSAVSSDSAARR